MEKFKIEDKEIILDGDKIEFDGEVFTEFEDFYNAIHAYADRNIEQERKIACERYCRKSWFEKLKDKLKKWRYNCF